MSNNIKLVIFFIFFFVGISLITGFCAVYCSEVGGAYSVSNNSTRLAHSVILPHSTPLR